MKEFKSIEEQIELLKKEKNIEFEDIEEAKKFLFNNNYYNVISSSKIKYVETIQNSKHQYKKTKFSDWISYYEKDIQASCYLMKLMINFEKTLNSRTAYYISELIESNNKVSFSIKSHLKKIIEDSQVKNLPDYTSNETWRYVTKMEFGKMKKLIYYLSKYSSNGYLKNYLKNIIDGLHLNKNNLKTDLDEINNLRNHLFHFTPLNIYISNGVTGTKNKKLSNTKRKKAINIMMKNVNNKKSREYLEIAKYLEEFYNASDKFIDIKNNQ